MNWQPVWESAESAESLSDAGLIKQCFCPENIPQRSDAQTTKQQADLLSHLSRATKVPQKHIPNQLKAFQVHQS